MDAVIVTVVTVAVIGPLVTLIHELGHAVAAVALGRRVDVLAVGHHEDLTVTVGRTVLRFGRSLEGKPSGFVTLDPASSPDEVIAIALMGPLANLITAPLFAAAAQSDATSGWLATAIWLLAFISVIVGLGNLIPSRTGGGDLSDGALIKVALAIHRGRPLPEIPDPVPAAPASDEPEPRTRRTFVGALALAVVVGLLAGGLVMVAPVILLFGYVFVTGGHRTKAF